MSRLHKFAGGLAALTLLAGGCIEAELAPEATQNSKPTPPPELLPGTFGCRVFRELAEQEKGNLLISPFSLERALSLLEPGARGETAELLTRALGSGAVGPVVRQRLESLHRSAPENGEVLAVADALWPAGDLPLDPATLETLRREFGATVQPLDYRDSDAAAAAINTWVDRETRGLIPTLLQPGQLSAVTRLVLTDALYFRGEWAEPFAADETRPGRFRLLSGETVELLMMRREGQIRHFRTAEAEGVELPYRGGRSALLLVLPNPGYELADLEKKLTPELIREWTAQLREIELLLQLPKCSLDFSSPLSPVLKQLGLGPLFSAGADFSGLSPEPLALSEVIHKTRLQLDEQGTEAAAATAVIMLRGMPQVVPRFTVDRPFLLLLRSGDELLFVGRVADPR